MNPRLRLYVFVLSAIIAAPILVLAGSTRIWESAGFAELNQGETDGTLVSSNGEVSLGYRGHKLDLKNVGLVWSAVTAQDSAVYLGTGYNGKIYRVKNDRVDEIASTGQMVITSLALDKKGNLFAATLPDPIIWRIEGPDKINANVPIKAEEWTKLNDGAEHILALSFSLDGNTLFAGTGPDGKLFAVGMDKKASVYLDTEEEHILCITAQKKGSILVGTSPSALLLEVTGPGRAKALADLDGTEVKALVAKENDIYAAVNEFKKPNPVPVKPANPVGTFDSSSNQTTRDNGKSKIYKIKGDSGIEELAQFSTSHAVSLAMSNEDELFVGLGSEGKIISIDSERVKKTVLDVDERQITAIVASNDLALVATGDTGAVYSVSRAENQDAYYYSPVLDSKAVSKWGGIRFYTKGKLTAQSRSGNTKHPDSDWSDWSKPVREGEILTSPSARYLQLRFSWALDAAAVLVSAEVAYRPQNERAKITDLDPGSPFPKTSASKDKEEEYVSARTTEARPKTNDTEIEITWTVDNPDDDLLRYQLWYRALATDLWRLITPDDQTLTTKRYTWKTVSIPEGRYQIRLRADDSPSNDPNDVLSDEFISVPILVDNHQPEVSNLSFKGGALKGIAQDNFSAISALEYSVDSGPWFPLFSMDGVFDEKKEEFELKDFGNAKPGPHAVAVRAWDRAGNAGIGEIHIQF